jgi:hypothetical protein
MGRFREQPARVTLSDAEGRRRLVEQTAYWRSYAKALDAILRGS